MNFGQSNQKILTGKASIQHDKILDFSIKTQQVTIQQNVFSRRF